MYFILAIIIAIVAFCFGVFATVLVMKERKFGTLKMMESDDGDPYLYLDMDRHPELIGKYKFVVFLVDFKSGGSHE